MISVGGPLKAARENKRMTVSEVAAETRLQTQVISAIERDDFSSVPAPIYARGFIRLYAKCVGIDPAPLVSAYNDYHAPGAPKKGLESAKMPAEAAVPCSVPAPIRGRARPGKKADIGKRRLRLQFPRVNTDFLTRIHLPRYRIPRINFRAFSGIHLPLLNITRIEKATQSGIQELKQKLLKVPHFRWRGETRQRALSIAMALALVIAAVAGLLWHSGRNRPPQSESYRIQEPPTPYLDSLIKEERSH